VLTVALRFFVGQKITLSILNMNGRQGRIFCATKNLKGTVNRVQENKNRLKGQLTKNRAVLTVALEIFCWTKNNSEHINVDSKREGFFVQQKILKGQSTE
jgi:hypothetical protein